MSVIYKYTLMIEGEQLVKMPKGSRILCVQMQYQQPRVWVAIDPFETENVDRLFFVVGTGSSIPGDGVYIGTVQEQGGSLVWHFFDGGEI